MQTVRSKAVRSNKSNIFQRLCLWDLLPIPYQGLALQGSCVIVFSMSQGPCFFQKLLSHPGVRADFVGRIEGVDVDLDRQATLARLEPSHRLAVQSMGFSWSHLHRAEQVHGSEVAIVGEADWAQTHEGVDGLITAHPGFLLGIYVADCGAVYISDPVKGVLALLHSGKKGTEEQIVTKALQLMIEQFDCQARHMDVCLAPCIRPPAYEIDFASEIKNQVLAMGVKEAHFSDSGVCTSTDLDHYYSYRVEQGATGRMLALLGRREG